MKRSPSSFALILACLLSLAACGTPPPVVAPTPHPTPAVQRLRTRIAALLGAQDLERGTWGVAVRSLTRDEALCAVNAGKLLMPASAMKLITLAAAAERLGWDYTYETRLIAAGRIDSGFLDGDLVVVGTGDPSIDDWDGAAARLFETWADRLKEMGVRSIGGRVIGDDNAFEDEGLGSGWAWDDLDRSFATAAGALQFNQNTAQILVSPGASEGDPASVILSPGGSGLAVRNFAVTSAADATASLVTRRAAGSPTLDVRGSVPVGAPAALRNVSVVNPTLYFASHLRDRLIASGIDVRGQAADIDDLSERPHFEHGTPLLSHRSPPLSALAATMMKNSQNLYAETLLKTAAAMPVNTTEAGRAAVRLVLDRWGLPDMSTLVADGSGLSRYNLATADALVRVLAAVYDDERLSAPFVAALPLAGTDGTLAGRMKGTAAEANVRAKTGTFSQARSLAGYVRTADGELLAFAIIANNFGVPAAVVDRTIDHIVVSLADFRR